MKDFDNIEDWYRDELDGFNVNPDNKVWDSLSDELDANMTLTDDNISEWYQREVNKLEERPDYTVWEKLATKLDTTSVWDKLVVSLNEYDKFIWWRNTILKGTAILLLLGGSFLTYYNYTNNNGSNNNSISEINNTSLTQNSKVLIKEKETKTSIVNTHKNTVTATSFYTDEKTSQLEDKTENKNVEKTINVATKKAAKKNSNSFEQKPDNKNETLYASIKVNDWEELKSNKSRTILTETERREITSEDISHTLPSGEFLVKKEKNKIVFNSKRFSSYTSYGLYARRFYLGLNAGFKKQSLFSEIKKESNLSNFNQIEYLDFGSNAGVTVGYILSDKINLESNINLFSSSGYKKRFNGEGSSYEESLNLNYSTINLLAKKMSTKSTFDNKVYSTNLIAGVYASWLYSANSNINGVVTANKNYNNTDLGIVLGIEQDRYLSKTLVLTPGIRYNQGLTNIANNSNSFKSARNYSLEFNIGLKYIFLKTSK